MSPGAQPDHNMPENYLSINIKPHRFFTQIFDEMLHCQAITITLGSIVKTYCFDQREMAISESISNATNYDPVLKPHCIKPQISPP